MMVTLKIIDDVNVIVNMWPIIAPQLREDLKHKTDGSTEDLVYQRLISKTIFMTQIFVDDKYAGFFTAARNFSRPGYLLLFNIFLDHSLPSSTMKEAVEAAGKLWKPKGIKGVHFYADRKAFQRRLAPAGFTVGSIELIKEF